MKALPLLITLLSFYSNAETKVFEEFQFYEVAPTSKNDILRTLNRTSPIRKAEGVEKLKGSNLDFIHQN